MAVWIWFWCEGLYRGNEGEGEIETKEIGKDYPVVAERDEGVSYFGFYAEENHSGGSWPIKQYLIIRPNSPKNQALPKEQSLISLIIKSKTEKDAIKVKSLINQHEIIKCSIDIQSVYFLAWLLQRLRSSNKIRSNQQKPAIRQGIKITPTSTSNIVLQ